MSGPIVVAEGLGKDYREGFWMRRKPALLSVGFSLDAGLIYGLLGPNGAGKSTLIHLLMGFLRPTRGQVTLFGRRPRDPESRRRVGFLPEVFAFDRFPTGRKLMLRFDALTGAGATGRESRVRDAIEAMGLSDTVFRRVGAFSKGMTQRIGLAQAILGDPELLVLDEPMSGMDPAMRHATREMLSTRRRRGKTTLLSSHILADVEALADRVLILDRGRAVGEGPLSSFGPGASVTTIAFRDERPDRFDPFLAELGLERSLLPGSPDVYRVTVPSTDVKNLVVARLAAERADIVSVSTRTADLERIFLDLTGDAGVRTFVGESSGRSET